MQTRRSFLATTGATVTLLPFTVRSARADAHSGDTFETADGTLTVHPIAHASFVLQAPIGTIYVDPTGDMSAYDGLPAPDLILITHEHGDHYDPALLAQLVAGEDKPRIISNPAVNELFETNDLRGLNTVLANGENDMIGDLMVEAVPAYNTTQERLNFHPEGRDNGYVLTMGDFRIYISGDTEDTPEMRALEDIDLAFVCMNLPFTMDAEAAASAVAEFSPTYVYPYHYRGRDDGTQDPAEFAALLPATGIEVKMGDWYS